MRGPWLQSLVGMAVLGYGASPSPAAIYVSGQVSLSLGRGPVPQAGVSLYPSGDSGPVAWTITLQNGSFVLQAPSTGIYRLEVRATSVETYSQPIEVPSVGLTHLDIEVDPLPAIRLRLLSTAGVVVHPSVARCWMIVTTERIRDGAPFKQIFQASFTPAPTPSGIMDLVPPRGIVARDACQVLIGARVAHVGCAQLNVTHWPAGRVDLRLYRGAAIVGNVVDGNGKPLAGVAVDANAMPPTEKCPLSPGPCMGVISTITDSKGQFKLDGLIHHCDFAVRAPIPGAGIRCRIVNTNSDLTAIKIGPSDLEWLGGLPHE